jgi:ectoine hydroxylase-related dioxygenase (phytanoyl-CoA dioxygenase family)
VDVTSEQRAAFERDGFLIIDNPCPEDLVDAVVEEFEERFNDDFDPGPETMRDGVLYAVHRKLRGSYHWQRIQNAWKVSRSARELALAPRVLSVLETLYARRPKPFQTLNFPVGTQQSAHADAMFFASEPDGYMCGVWVALEDVDMENGPLVYYPGSHKLPSPSNVLVEEFLGETNTPESFPTQAELRSERNRQYAVYCQRLIESHDLRPQHATIKRGQAMIWASNLLHGGAVQKDPARTRRSQVTHYLFEGSRLRRPLWTEGELVYWDYPVWVRDEPPSFSPRALQHVVAANVPAGAKVLVVTRGDHTLGDVPVDSEPFPQDDGGNPLQHPISGAEGVAMLERLRGEGAEYVVVPQDGMGMLQVKMPEVQQVLERQSHPMFVDGSTCAIYDLR